MTRLRWIALAAGLLAFSLYDSTLLPGFDFGDTGSFQATVGEPTIRPRDGYPLYLALGGAVQRLTHIEPARALNLASAFEGAAAAAVLTLVAATLCGSELFGFVAALLLAGSYTFWSQAIIAEVYALHVLFISLSLLLLLRWSDHPDTWRLALFFGVYALGFGNHLSMILLAPGYTFFLLASAPRGWRSMFGWRTIGLALVFACAGALQYTWNLRGLWLDRHPPHGLVDALGAFWFDVTKTDWRETMVMHVPGSLRADRLAMYWFDLRQQFGWPVVLFALAGLATLLARRWRVGVLIALLYAVNVVFAFTYNVGDTHVFYIPSHVMVALLAGCGLAAAARRLAETAASRRRWSAVFVGALSLAYVSARIVRDYPALDRSQDTRPDERLSALTSGLDDRNGVLLTDLNWQLQNGLTYFAKARQRSLATARLADVLMYLPVLVDDNALIHRDVAITEHALPTVRAAYGPLFDIVSDPRVTTAGVSDMAAALPTGTRYVLSVLAPTRDATFNREDLDKAVRMLTGGPARGFATRQYAVLAGVAGAGPELVHQDDRPFRLDTRVAGTPVSVRMESWLGADTIRRMGFGQVVAARRHTLIVERGVSFAAFDAGGHPLRVAYAANIFAPERRYLIRLRSPAP